MSRQSHLPPRCPFQKKPVVHPFQDTSPKLQKYPSQSYVYEDQPSWLDDLLSEQDAEPVRNSLRRSTSDSAALLGGSEECFADLSFLKNDAVSAESSSMYGPNSPRQRSFVSLSDNIMNSALSEYAVLGNLSTPEHAHPTTSMGETSSETKIPKRHSGQRSRVRKLQYIAELERTVETLQTIESELAVNVASLLQTRVSLSLENSKLKQSLARRRQEKSFMEGQYKTMKKEAERLRSYLQNPSGSLSRRSNSGGETSRSNLTWKMLDMANLNLN